MNRFIPIGKYNIVTTKRYSCYYELLDTKTGIVYLQITNEEGPDNITPLLFDNGKPQHLNKDEVEKIKTMICQIGEERYERVIKGSYAIYKDEEEFQKSHSEWTTEDIYNALCKTK